MFLYRQVPTGTNCFVHLGSKWARYRAILKKKWIYLHFIVLFLSYALCFSLHESKSCLNQWSLYSRLFGKRLIITSFNIFLLKKKGKKPLILALSPKEDFKLTITCTSVHLTSKLVAKELKLLQGPQEIRCAQHQDQIGLLKAVPPRSWNPPDQSCKDSLDSLNLYPPSLSGEIFSLYPVCTSLILIYMRGLLSFYHVAPWAAWVFPHVVQTCCVLQTSRHNKFTYAYVVTGRLG